MVARHGEVCVDGEEHDSDSGVLCSSPGAHRTRETAFAVLVLRGGRKKTYMTRGPIYSAE